MRNDKDNNEKKIRIKYEQLTQPILLYTILREFGTVLLTQLLEQVICYLKKHFERANLKKLGLLSKK